MIKAPALIIGAALILGSLITAPAIQMSFASSGKVTKGGDKSLSGGGGGGSDGSSGSSSDKGDSSPKAEPGHGGGTPACGGCPGQPTQPGEGVGGTPPGGHVGGEPCGPIQASCRGPIPTPNTPPSGLTDTQKEDSVACDETGTKCDDGQDHSHDGFRGGCFHFGTKVTCGVCRGPNDLVIKCGQPRTIVTTQVIRVPVATPGLTIAQAASLSARIAQLQSFMSKPYGTECKSQIQTLLDVTQQALDAQNGFIADHLPTLQQGIPACYGSNAEQITETS